MKAVVYEKKSAPDVFVLREVAQPVPQANEVLVKIYAVSVNAGDYRSVQMGSIPKHGIFGADIAGKIEAVGNSVTMFKVGDEVFGDISGCGFGGFAEYVAVPEKVLALKPAAVSFEDASALSLAGVTALQGLRNAGKIQPGQKVLINGAGGGVGTFAVQLAKYFGAEVTAVCGAHNVELVRSLGADEVIDYKKEDFLTSGKKYDLVLGVNGNRPLTDYPDVLAAHGIFVIVGGRISQVIKTLVFGPIMSLGSKKYRALAAKPDAKDASYMIKLVEEGKIKPVIDRRYALHETAQAMRYVCEGHTRGKVVITVV
jgi:NADPH:quinone reductase-like Zn-dependent oxidoreductase